MSDPTASTPDYTASGALLHQPLAPVGAPVDVSRDNQYAAQPVLAQPVRRNRALIVWGTIGIVVLSLITLFVAFYLVAGLGPVAFAIAGIMALIPLTIVFLGLKWIDRWEPEPRGAIAFAFLWGAGMSVLIALIVGAEIDAIIMANGGPGPAYEFFGAAIQAPVVEEVGKGFGLLLLFWFARKHFDGPVDGLVYAGWIAGGFAFTENILYFGSALLDGGGLVGVAEIFIIRGLMSPFAHVMFTAFTGILLGLAARRTNGFGAIGFWILGLIPAMALHAFWNGALFFVYDFYGYYFLVQVPLFIGVVLLVLWLRRQEAKLTYDRLLEYASVGWFSTEEVSTIATFQGRRMAMQWANQRGIGRLMRRYIKDATKLAFARQRIVTGRNRIGAQADEQVLLGAILASRHALRSAPVSR